MVRALSTSGHATPEPGPATEVLTLKRAASMGAVALLMLGISIGFVRLLPGPASEVAAFMFGGTAVLGLVWVVFLFLSYRPGGRIVLVIGLFAAALWVASPSTWRIRFFSETTVIANPSLQLPEALLSTGATLGALWLAGAAALFPFHLLVNWYLFGPNADRWRMPEK